MTATPIVRRCPVADCRRITLRCYCERNRAATKDSHARQPV